MLDLRHGAQEITAKVGAWRSAATSIATRASCRSSQGETEPPHRESSRAALRLRERTRAL